MILTALSLCRRKNRKMGFSQPRSMFNENKFILLSPLVLPSKMIITCLMYIKSFKLFFLVRKQVGVNLEFTKCNGNTQEERVSCRNMINRSRRAFA